MNPPNLNRGAIKGLFTNANKRKQTQISGSLKQDPERRQTRTNARKRKQKQNQRITPPFAQHALVQLLKYSDFFSDFTGLLGLRLLGTRGRRFWETLSRPIFKIFRLETPRLPLKRPKEPKL